MTPSELERKARRLESLVETQIVREHRLIPIFVRAGDYQLPAAEDYLGAYRHRHLKDQTEEELGLPPMHVWRAWDNTATDTAYYLAALAYKYRCTGVSPRPGEAEVISVFPAWPGQWDAEFRLHARGGFEVWSRHASGAAQFVEVRSQLGEPCRLRNPWGERCRVEEASGRALEVEGEVLRFDTVAGGHLPGSTLALMMRRSTCHITPLPPRGPHRPQEQGQDRGRQRRPISAYGMLPPVSRRKPGTSL